MASHFLVTGAIIGFSIAAPIGPVGVCIIRKTLQFGRVSGVAAALGATIGAALFAIISAFGLTFISDFIREQNFLLRLIGGVILVGLGVKTLFSLPLSEKDGVWRKSFLSDCMSTLLLNLTNPMTILPYLAVFAGFSEQIETYLNATLTVLGVILGSIAWWAILIEGVGFFRRKMTQNAMTWINRIAGVIIIAFGLVLWGTLL